MKKFIISIIVLLFILSPIKTYAQDIDYSEQFFRGEIIEILGNGKRDAFESEIYYQILNVKLLEGEDIGEEFRLEYSNPMVRNEPQLLGEGDKVVMIQIQFDGDATYEIYEPYRLNNMLILVLLFVGLAVLISGRRGFMSLVGLGVTLFILITWIIPSIVSGGNPLLISFLGAVVVAVITLYLSHGFTKRTTLALISTLITLVFSVFIALFSVSFSRLFGLGSEDAAYLSFGYLGDIDLRGLFLGAIIIGALGVLDDVTTTQVAVIDEIYKANKSLDFRKLYKKGMSVGREHIASMINTLVIAYVGASLPAFLMLTLSTRPLWVMLNNEFLAEEVVRTLAGSMTLMLAVPISTVLAAYYYGKNG